jgi:hypothetical protein
MSKNFPELARQPATMPHAYSGVRAKIDGRRGNSTPISIWGIFGQGHRRLRARALVVLVFLNAR